MAPPKRKTEAALLHRFDFIHTADFRSTSFFSYLRYLWVWLAFLKAILIVCGDIWTWCIFLISGDWADSIQLAISLSTARWIFSASMVLSLVLLVFDLVKANRVIKSSDISYVVSNPIVSAFYCMQKYDHFCFIMKIRHSNKMVDKLSFFVFFQLKGWKHLVIQTPRQAVNIMTLVAFMKTLDSDLNRLREVTNLTSFTFFVMAFTSLMFVLSALTALVAMLLWIPLAFKIQGKLKDNVFRKMGNRVEAVIKETMRKRARKARVLERMVDEESHHNQEWGSRVQRAKPTLPNIDVILANSNQDDRRYRQAAFEQQQKLQQAQLQQQAAYLEQSLCYAPTSHEWQDWPSGYHSPPAHHRVPYHSSPSHHRMAYHSPPSQHLHLPGRKMSVASNYSQSHAPSEYCSPSLYQASLHSTDTAIRSTRSYSVRPHVSPRPLYRDAHFEDYHSQQPHYRPAPAVVRPPGLCEPQDEWLGAAYLDLLTPGSEPHSIQYFPDSGVLPDAADPYYQAMAVPSTAHSLASYGSSHSSLSSASLHHHHQQHPQADGTYQPDSIEMEHYNALYRDWSQTHQRVRQARNDSIRSRSPSAHSSRSGSAAVGAASPSFHANHHHHRDYPLPPSFSLPSIPTASSSNSGSVRGGSSPVTQSSRVSSRASSRTHRSPSQLRHYYGHDEMLDGCHGGTELILPARQASVPRLAVKPSHESLASSAHSAYNNYSAAAIKPALPSSDPPKPRAPQLWLPADNTDIPVDNEAVETVVPEARTSVVAEDSSGLLKTDGVGLDTALGVVPQAQVSMEKRHQQEEIVHQSDSQKPLSQEHTVDSHDVDPVGTMDARHQDVSTGDVDHRSVHASSTSQETSLAIGIHRVSHTSLQLQLPAQSPQLGSSLFPLPPACLPHSPQLNAAEGGVRPSLESLQSVASSATQRKKQCSLRNDL